MLTLTCVPEHPELGPNCKYYSSVSELLKHMHRFLYASTNSCDDDDDDDDDDDFISTNPHVVAVHLDLKWMSESLVIDCARALDDVMCGDVDDAKHQCHVIFYFNRRPQVDKWGRLRLFVDAAQKNNSRRITVRWKCKWQQLDMRCDPDVNRAIGFQVNRHNWITPRFYVAPTGKYTDSYLQKVLPSLRDNSCPWFSNSRLIRDANVYFENNNNIGDTGMLWGANVFLDLRKKTCRLTPFALITYLTVLVDEQRMWSDVLSITDTNDADSTTTLLHVKHVVNGALFHLLVFYDHSCNMDESCKQNAVTVLRNAKKLELVLDEFEHQVCEPTGEQIAASKGAQHAVLTRQQQTIWQMPASQQQMPVDEDDDDDDDKSIHDEDDKDDDVDQDDDEKEQQDKDASPSASSSSSSWNTEAKVQQRDKFMEALHQHKIVPTQDAIRVLTLPSDTIVTHVESSLEHRIKTLAPQAAITCCEYTQAVYDKIKHNTVTEDVLYTNILDYIEECAFGHSNLWDVVDLDLCGNLTVQAVNVIKLLVRQAMTANSLLKFVCMVHPRGSVLKKNYNVVAAALGMSLSVSETTSNVDALMMLAEQVETWSTKTRRVSVLQAKMYTSLTTPMFCMVVHVHDVAAAEQQHQQQQVVAIADVEEVDVQSKLVSEHDIKKQLLRLYPVRNVEGKAYGKGANSPPNQACPRSKYSETTCIATVVEQLKSAETERGHLCRLLRALHAHHKLPWSIAAMKDALVYYDIPADAMGMFHTAFHDVPSVLAKRLKNPYTKQWWQNDWHETNVYLEMRKVALEKQATRVAQQHVAEYVVDESPVPQPQPPPPSPPPAAVVVVEADVVVNSVAKKKHGTKRAASPERGCGDDDAHQQQQMLAETNTTSPIRKRSCYERATGQDEESARSSKVPAVPRQTVLDLTGDSDGDVPAYDIVDMVQRVTDCRDEFTRSQKIELHVRFFKKLIAKLDVALADVKKDQKTFIAQLTKDGLMPASSDDDDK